MQTPSFQQWWQQRNDWFGEKFRAFLDEKMQEATGALVDDVQIGIQMSDRPSEVRG
jgi:hypothetical protein